MSYTVTIDEPDVVSYAMRRGDRYREELHAVVVAFVMTQMKRDAAKADAVSSNGKSVFEAFCACPADVDLNQFIPRRECSGQARAIDFARLLQVES